MKTKINSLYLSLLAGTLLTLGACSKNDDPQPLPTGPEEIGYYFLNEGSNLNSSLDFLGFYNGGYTENAYSGTIGKGGNDMIIYGSKLYITATDANKVIVLDAASKEELEVINIALPRYLLGYRGKVYVTAHGENKVTVLDTTSFSTNDIPVGRSPEQLTATGGKVYVTNSGWRDAATQGYDNRISVINPTTLTVEDNINVAENVQKIAADTVKNVLYIGASETFYGEKKPAKLYVYNTANRQLSPMEFGIEDIAIVRVSSSMTQAYMISSNYNGATKPTCLVMNLSNQTVQELTTGTSIQTPYSIDFLPQLGFIVVGDAKDYQSKGTMHFYQLYNDGRAALSGSQAVGVSPKAVAFNVNLKK